MGNGGVRMMLEWDEVKSTERSISVGKRKPAEGASMTQADIDNIDYIEILQMFRLSIRVPKFKRNMVTKP